MTTAQPIRPPCLYAEDLLMVSDCLNVLRESGPPPHDLSAVIAALARLEREAGNMRIALTFLAAIDQPYEMGKVALQCRELAGDAQKLFGAGRRGK